MERLGRLFTVFVFLIISIAGIAFSAYLFSIANDFYTYFIAIIFLALSVTSNFFNVQASYWYYKSSFFPEFLKKVKAKIKPFKTLPSVAVVMPTHDEDPAMIEKNVVALMKMDYPKDKFHIYLLNDSDDILMAETLGKTAKRHGIKFLYRSENRAFKAGALNNFLENSNEDFVAIFDADEFLTNQMFLKDLIPYFSDKKLAFIQTEKKYAKGSFFSDSVDVSDGFFFKFVESARTLSNTATFAGSCGIIRRSVLDEMGGFPEYAVEDTFFSFESSMNDYKGLYVPTVYALGKPINTFSKLVKQQWRYSYGHTQFISYMLKRKGLNKRPISSTMDYIAHGLGLNYLSLVLISFTIMSIAIVFSYLPFLNANLLKFLFTNKLSLEIELFGLFAFVLSMLAPMVLAKIYYNSITKGVMVFLLNYALAFVRAQATIAAFFNLDKKLSWNSKSELDAGFGLVVRKARTEVTFASFLLVLTTLALTEYNLIGALWMGWYSIMFFLSPLFFYKYG